ncbi:MAG: TrbC/VirB2 family protein [Clostridia bacterium]|nr:TrbC/VirB2 family protein [Clostridia bacterium]
MKNLKRVLGIVILIAMVAVLVSGTYVSAFDYGNFKADTTNTQNIGNVGNSIISTIRIIGMILSVGVLMILGIKYMVGSAEEKAEYKKTMIPYIVGAILIFAATFIVSAIYDFAQ